MLVKVQQVTGVVTTIDEVTKIQYDHNDWMLLKAGNIIKYPANVIRVIETYNDIDNDIILKSITDPEIVDNLPEFLLGMDTNDLAITFDSYLGNEELIKFFEELGYDYSCGYVYVSSITQLISICELLSIDEYNGHDIHSLIEKVKGHE